jgi:hypothetical protein
MWALDIMDKLPTRARRRVCDEAAAGLGEASSVLSFRGSSDIHAFRRIEGAG